MKVRHPHELPRDKEEKLRRAKRLEWLSIGFMLSIVIVMGLTMGNSQAMKAAWADDLLALIPPLAFLIATRFHGRTPNERFPYGYHRTVSIAFLVASVALLGFGLLLLYDSIITLAKQEHPTVDRIEVFGQRIWFGWLMIAALIYSILPNVVLGRLKLPVSEELHEKVLHADASMNKAAWMTSIAAILGILGVGLGWWWADAVAAGIISIDILWDGVTNLKHAVLDLMDERATTVDREKPDPLHERVRAEIERLEWVDDVAVRLREEGDVLTGEAYVVPKSERGLVEHVTRTMERIRALDWRLYDVVVVPVRSLDGHGGEPEGAG